MRSDWVLPICTGEERLKDADGARCIRRRSRRRCSTASCSPRRSPATWCSTRSSAPARPARSRSGSAAISSASSATATYVAAARQRIAATPPATGAVLKVVEGKRAEPRIPFGSLMEAGLVAAGDVLTDYAPPLRGHGARRRLAALRDGRTPASSGSIHRVGAAVQGLDACNGWTFWHRETNGALQPIDDAAHRRSRQAMAALTRAILAAGRRRAVTRSAAHPRSALVKSSGVPADAAPRAFDVRGANRRRTACAGGSSAETSACGARRSPDRA